MCHGENKMPPINNQNHFSLTLPESSSQQNGSNTIETNGIVVIIGANGSGKTRLGSWIEFSSANRDLVHRIAAQKSLSLPPFATAASIEAAEFGLLYGLQTTDRGHINNKTVHRWGQKPNTYMLNDYQQLMVYLFSEENEKSILYRNQSKKTGSYIEPPSTKLDIVRQIWEEVLPHRELNFRSGVVETNIKGVSGSKYNGEEMSDGERVIFYLIGQCLSAPTNGTIVIDEPELHLHKSIQAKLWDEIQAYRPDCLFIYLTHDLDFATSRIGASKIWIKSFDGNNWDWIEVPQNEGIPEEVLLTILGSRKPILFVEGTKDSLDYFIFRHLYSEYTVIPCGSCSDVIYATQSFRAMHNLHNLECKGIIDRDYRSAEQVEYLVAKNIYVLNVSEIENLLLVEDVIRYIASSLLIQDTEELVSRVKKKVLDELEKEKDKLIASITAEKTESILRMFSSKASNRAEFESQFDQFTSSIKIGDLFDSSLSEVETTIASRNYNAAIKLYNNKGLIYQLGPLFGMGPKPFIEYVQRLFSSDQAGALRTALSGHVPTLS